jgi:hypothetical protein
MSKLLLALTLLGVGARGFLTARQSTTRLQHTASATREVWLAETQLVAVAQRDQASLIEHVRELKQTLAQPPAVAESALWSALQTNRAGHLTPELRERVLEELGFNWQSSADFIVVSKETVREIGMQEKMVIQHGKFTDLASVVFALMPEERSQVEAAMQRVQTDSTDWALSHLERSEPKDDVVAQYTMPGDPAMLQSIYSNFTNGVLQALGRERAELLTASAWRAIRGTPPDKPTTMFIRRYLAGNEQRLKVQIQDKWGDASPRDLWRGPYHGVTFPDVLWPIFPNGWDDVAKREGFELPEKPQEK